MLEDPSFRQWTITVTSGNINKVAQHLQKAKIKGIPDLKKFKLFLDISCVDHEKLAEFWQTWQEHVYGVHVDPPCPLIMARIPMLETLSMYLEDYEEPEVVQTSKDNLKEILQLSVPNLKKLCLNGLYFGLGDLSSLANVGNNLETLKLCQIRKIGFVRPILNVCKNITKLEISDQGRALLEKNLELPALKHLTIDNCQDGVRFLRDNAANLESLFFKETTGNYKPSGFKLYEMCCWMKLPKLKTFICLALHMERIWLRVIEASANSLENLVFWGMPGYSPGLNKLRKLAFSCQQLEEGSMNLLYRKPFLNLEQVAFFDVVDSNFSIKAFKGYGADFNKSLPSLKKISLFVGDKDQHTDLQQVREDGRVLKSVYTTAKIDVGRGNFEKFVRKFALSHHF